MESPLLETREVRSRSGMQALAHASVGESDRPCGPGSGARWSGSNALMIVKETGAGAWQLFNALLGVYVGCRREL